MDFFSGGDLIFILVVFKYWSEEKQKIKITSGIEWMWNKLQLNYQIVSIEERGHITISKAFMKLIQNWLIILCYICCALFISLAEPNSMNIPRALSLFLPPSMNREFNTTFDFIYRHFEISSLVLLWFGYNYG